MAPITPGGQRLLPVDRAGHFVAFPRQIERECLAERAVVLDDQDLSLQFRSSI
jgi:hypothetical protein